MKLSKSLKAENKPKSKKRKSETKSHSAVDTTPSPEDTQHEMVQIIRHPKFNQEFAAFPDEVQVKFNEQIALLEMGDKPLVNFRKFLGKIKSVFELKYRFNATAFRVIYKLDH